MKKDGKDEKANWALVGNVFDHFSHCKSFWTGLLPASPVRKGGVKGSYTKMAIFLTGKPRPGGRGGFTLVISVALEDRHPS